MVLVGLMLPPEIGRIEGSSQKKTSVVGWLHYSASGTPGTSLRLGISPIVTSGWIMQLLAGSRYLTEMEVANGNLPGESLMIGRFCFGCSLAGVRVRLIFCYRKRLEQIRLGKGCKVRKKEKHFNVFQNFVGTWFKVSCAMSTLDIVSIWTPVMFAPLRRLTLSWLVVQRLKIHKASNTTPRHHWGGPVARGMFDSRNRESKRSLISPRKQFSVSVRNKNVSKLHKSHWTLDKAGWNNNWNVFEDLFQVVVQDTTVTLHIRFSASMSPSTSCFHFLGARSLKEDRNLFFAAQKLFGLLITLGEANLTRPMGIFGILLWFNCLTIDFIESCEILVIHMIWLSHVQSIFVGQHCQHQYFINLLPPVWSG